MFKDIYKDGRHAGSAAFEAKNSRFVGSEEALKGMVDKLFPN